jgi:plasmid maintenance system antidote protein VapI
MTGEKLRPVHSGEVLLEEFLKPMGLSQNRLALSIGVSARRINEIVLGKRGDETHRPAGGYWPCDRLPGQR